MRKRNLFLGHILFGTEFFEYLVKGVSTSLDEIFTHNFGDVSGVTAHGHMSESFNWFRLRNQVDWFT